MLPYEMNKESTMNISIRGESWVDTDEDLCCIPTDTMVSEDRYATAPLPTVRSTNPQVVERELHTSFEEAINDRVLAVNSQLKGLSITRANIGFTRSRHDALMQRQGLIARPVFPGNIRQRTLLFASMASMLILAIFDLVCLFLLHLH